MGFRRHNMFPNLTSLTILSPKGCHWAAFGTATTLTRGRYAFRLPDRGQFGDALTRTSAPEINRRLRRASYLELASLQGNWPDSARSLSAIRSIKTHSSGPSAKTT